MNAAAARLAQISSELKDSPLSDKTRELWDEFKKVKAVINQENENRFFKMLEAAPELKQYWDIPERMPKMKSIQTALHRKGKEDGVLLRFFGSVWFGNSDMFDFDFIHAVKHMSERDIKIVRKWLVSPFFC
ncbi:hypothetical protein [Kangiella sp.]|uniref:hypothetical protein n=1 Tax=Kangiella sp. TaxID=1920245 RepID=UPI003A9489AE